MRSGIVFVFFWLGLFLLYWPAARAGWVSDTIGWLDALRHQNFEDFVMRRGFKVKSFYQLTQVVTWALYQMLGANRWAWHILQLSLHVINATLLFSLMRSVFRDSRIELASAFAFSTASLFCCSPYVSEVIVWEASFHFLQGLLLLLVQLHLLHGYLRDGGNSKVVFSIVLYALSLFSLELFYLAPVLGLALCLYYSCGLGWDRGRVKAAIYRFVLPQVVMLTGYFMVLWLVFNMGTGRLAPGWIKLPITYFLVKPQECVFHLLGGRFLPQAWRAVAYKLCSSYLGAGLFYIGAAVVVLFIVLRFRKLGVTGKAMSWLMVWLLVGLVLLSPLWFPEQSLILGDRYLYVILPPFLGLAVLSLGCWLGNSRALRWVILLLVVVQCGLTLKVNNLWRVSAQMTDSLQESLRGTPEQFTLILNSPASLCGAPMIGASIYDEALLMHNLLYEPAINSTVRETVAMPMLHPSDRISIEVLNNQTIKVSLTDLSTHWQYGPDVARSYSTNEYSVTLDSSRRSYRLELTLHPSVYRILYQEDGQWKELPFTDH